MSGDREDTKNASRYRLTLAALGIVFGDIGTSPLYALRACFVDTGGMAMDPANVLGVLSLIFWSLALVISLKYVGLVLRADNRGEGGVLALTALVLSRAPRGNVALLAGLGLAGCALFYGDGVITPAISVLSAIEGITVATPALQRYVVPLAVVVLYGLFRLQKRGTGAVGRLFGPIMLVWFAALAVLGVIAIAARPIVLEAVNPLYAIGFLQRHGAAALAVLGAAFLAVTGGEALYADLGHFGRAPITRAWFVMVWPSLLLNYFGQGALLLAKPDAIQNPFYLLAPPWLLVPMVVLATCATIIASQAVISGVFSITQQCQQLGYLPRLEVHHSSAESIGQVYVPVANWLLCIVTLGVVLAFGSSSALANAYGIAVSGTMVIVTALMLVLMATRRSRTARLEAVTLAALGIVDAAFLVANFVKVPQGGWFPLLFGALILAIMATWQRGRTAVATRMMRDKPTLESLRSYVQEHPPARAPGCAVFMTSDPAGLPRTLMRNLRHNGTLHEHTIVMTVFTEPSPRVPADQRVTVKPLAPGLDRVYAHIGFMERPDVPALLREAERQGLQYRIGRVTYFLGGEDVVIGLQGGMAPWRKYLFVFLLRNAQSAADHFGFDPERVVELGGRVRI